MPVRRGTRGMSKDWTILLPSTHYFRKFTELGWAERDKPEPRWGLRSLTGGELGAKDARVGVGGDMHVQWNF